MTHTEKDAKALWCCVGMANLESIKCAASECMAWRWGMGMKMIAPPSNCLDCKGTGFIPNDTDTENVGCSTCEGTWKIGHFEKIGYCGLVGKENR